MNYTPKPGDKVTSPLLVGEWQVERDYASTERITKVRQGSGVAFVSYDDLTLVATPLPPEPAVGGVVWAWGSYWRRANATYWTAQRGGYHSEKRWSDLAPDAVPVVPVDKVAEWLGGVGLTTNVRNEVVRLFRDEFGGWSE